MEVKYLNKIIELEFRRLSFFGDFFMKITSVNNQ